MAHNQTKVAVVSGATRGIGRDTANLLIADGYAVYGLSRKAGDDDRVSHISCDVSVESDVQSAIQQVVEKTGRIDLLVCNAGFGIAGAVELTPVAQAESQMAVNFMGTFNCVKYALPALRKSKGRIVMISSAASAFPLPYQAFYSASKSAVTALALGLRDEVKPHGVSVTVCLPGDVNTGFAEARHKHLEDCEIYGSAPRRSVEQMERDEANGMSSDYVASKIYKMCVRKRVKPMYVIGTKYKVIFVAGKIFPTSFVRWCVGKVYG